MPQPPSIGPAAWKISPSGGFVVDAYLAVHRVVLLLRAALEFES